MKAAGLAKTWWRPILAGLALGVAVLPGRVHAQLLQQNFSSSTTVANYANASPSSGQWNGITTSGAGMVLSIDTGGSNNKMRFARTANAGAMTRTTDFSPTPSTAYMQFDLNVSGNSVAQTTAAIVYLGAGFTSGNGTEANANVHSRIGINWTTTAGQYSLRNIGGAVNSANYSGTQTVRLFVNNSGASVTYTSPSGTQEAVANDTADVWIGTTREFNDMAATTATQVLTDEKFVFTAGTGTIDLDNFLIDPIPAAPVSAAASGETSSGFTANWATVSGVTGYRLDVATDSGFTAFVSGYNNLAVSGQATASYAVTGLSASTLYYFRVRAETAHTVGTVTSAHSGSQSTTTLAGGTPAITLADNGTQVTAGNVNAGATDHVLHQFQCTVATANATLNQVDFTTAGSYVAADLTNLKLRYSTDSTLDGGDATLGTLTTSLGTGSKSFTGLTQAITTGSTGYFFITTDVAGGATGGNTLNVNAIGTADLTFASGTKSGSTTAGGAQTIVSVTPSIVLADNGTQVGAASVNAGTTAHVLHKFEYAVTVANATLTQVDVTTAGSYVGADLTNLKLRYSTDSTLDGGDATLGTLVASLDPGAKSFTGLSQLVAAGNTGYFFVTADIAASPTDGNTISVNAIGTGNLTFATGTKSGSTTAGGTQTISVPTPAIALADNGAQVAAATVNSGLPNQVLHKFQCAVTVLNATLNQVDFTTAGSYAAADLSALKLRYSADATLDSADATLGTLTASLGAGAKSFTGLTQSITAGSTGYFFITADIAKTGVTDGNTLNVQVIGTADLTFAAGSKSGSTTAGGAQTLNVPATVFAETIGTTAGTTTLAAHEAANGFDNDTYTMTSGGAANPADIRDTNPSTPTTVYTNPVGTAASAVDNVFFSSTSGAYGFAIEGIDTTTHSALELSFGYRKDNGAANATFALEWSSDGSIWTPLTVIGLPPASAATGWYMVAGTPLPGGAQVSNLRIRWVKSGTISMRLDDILLRGDVLVPSITLADNGTQVTAANVYQGTSDHVLHTFQCGVTVANATLNQVAFTTAGSYVAADLTNLKLRYSTDSTLDGGDATLGTLVASLGPGAKSFTGLTQAITAGSTGYFFITADFPLSATVGNDIAVQAIGTSDLTFSAGTKSGSTTAGGAQTIVVTPNDLTMASAGGEAATISSVENDAAIATTADGAQAWQLTFSNPAGNAGAATLSAITLTQGAGNQPANWTTTIRAAGLFDGSTLLGTGTIGASSLAFTGLSVGVADAASKTLTLRLSLQNTATLTDGDNLEFALTSGNVSLSGNGLTTASVDSDEAQNQIVVVASQLVFSGVPASVYVNQDFGLTLTAQDANGNTDPDATTLATLSVGTGSGALSSTAGLTQSLAAGTYAWSDLKIDTAGSFTVRATSTFPQVDSSSISASVATKQLLDDFNRADNTTVGNGWTESESGVGTSALRVNGSQMQAYYAGTAVAGRELLYRDVSGLYATTYANAGSSLEWVFNMRQGRAAPGGWSAGSYASAFILGSSATDPQNGNGSGYAVIIGESGALDTIRLVRFTGGLNGDTDWTAIVSQSPAATLTDYFSIKVTFDPSTGTWELFTRDDGAAAFADPAVGSLTSRGTAVNTTHTSLDLKYLSAYNNHGTAAAGAANGAVFDNVYAPTALATVPSVALANNAPQVTAGNVNAATVDHVLHKFQLSATVANATLTAVSFTSAGTYVAADVSAFRVWYSTDSTFGGDTQLGADITTSLGTGSHGVSGLSQAITSGSTGYIFVTVDIAAAPTAGNTINVSAIATADVMFSSAVKSGSSTAGGVQTLSAAVNDGDGSAAVFNQDGTALDGSDIFRRTLGSQVAEVTVTGVAVGTLEGVEVDLPAGWSGLALGNVTLSGAGFGGATASTPDSDTIRVTGGAVTSTDLGVVTVSGLTARGSTGVTDDGDDTWTVRTRKTAGTFTAIAAMPAARITIPIANIRDVDVNGVSPDVTDEVAIEGVTTFTNELSLTTTQAYIQDSTAGTIIFNNTPNLITHLHRYVVYGDVLQFNGLTEVQPPGGASDIYDLGADTVTPVAKTLAEILAAPEALEGTLVEVSGLGITSGTWPASGDASLTVSDDCGTTFSTLRIDTDTGIDGQAEPAEPFSVVAVVSQFDNSSPYTSGYQIIPRKYADFTGGVALTAPVANDGANADNNSFDLGWSAVAGATEYRVDVSLYPTFTEPGLVAGSNAYHNGVLGAGTPAGWTESGPGGQLFQASGYIGMTGTAAVVISPAMNFNATSAEMLNFNARTFGGINAANNTITVSISINNGSSWAVLGTRTPLNTGLTAMAPFDISGYSGTQVKVKFETLGSASGRGAGINEMIVNAQVAGIVPSYVSGYDDLQVLAMNLTVSGLPMETTYYYRVRGGVCASVTGPDSNVATAQTTGKTVFMFK